ncbi:LacI family DNA-binding transcriptional regulator [Anaeromicropila herbilytica]|uniref:LacI family transcriptional regulator n=1 Tax=Anaeromicropila herbilytica TaxID=2785025 RepID=A0A7R7IC70_9FIRM|nr:LacI family DNA-binding transcriptional regulator [Anaeromicropila herbilytica]BCN30277.1 LacI family transcriptional regulator [Anaeromicropila herbilytica]
MKKNITVYDIASEAGVSVATVSRVLTNNANVAELTRKKVQDVIDKYDFQPNALARSLFKNETKMIGCILPDITNPYYSSVFLEAENYALDLGYTLVLCNTMDKIMNDGIYFQTLVERQVDGIIYMGRHIATSKESESFKKIIAKYTKRLPVVMINCDYSDDNCYLVQSSEEESFLGILELLVQKGHRKIALIGGIQGVKQTDIKRNAFHRAVEKYNLDVKEEYIIEGDYTIEAGVNMMTKLLSAEDRPTAVMGINDIVSIGALKACQMNQIRVPEDIVITGFDNIPLSHYVYPSLTTVSHDYEKLGRKAVDIICDLSLGKTLEKKYEYSMNVIERDSI